MKKATVVLICSLSLLSTSLYASSTTGTEGSSAPGMSTSNSASPQNGATTSSSASPDLIIDKEWCKANPAECKVKREERLKWCRENKEECRTKLEAWCKTNPEECKTKANKWCENHPAMCNQLKEKIKQQKN